eukprot:6880657-Alexandrium_andersonii.AAC.1
MMLCVLKAGIQRSGDPLRKVREAAPFLAPGVDGLAGRFEDLQRFRRQTKELDGLGCGVVAALSEYIASMRWSKC